MLARAELSGTDEDRGDDAVGVALGERDEREMAVMQRAHCWHECDAFARLPPRGETLSQVGYGAYGEGAHQGVSGGAHKGGPSRVNCPASQARLPIRDTALCATDGGSI